MLFDGEVVVEEDDGDIGQREGGDEGVAEGEEGEGVDEEHDVGEFVEAESGHEDVVDDKGEDDRDDEDGVELHGGLLGRGSPKFSPRCTRPRWRGRGG